MIEEIIPANPPLGGHGSKQYREAVAANEVHRVEAKVKVVIPPPPVATAVPYTIAERRKFVQPTIAARDEVFRSRR